MVELSLKTRGQGRGGGANEFGRRAPAIVRCARSDGRRFAAASRRREPPRRGLRPDAREGLRDIDRHGENRLLAACRLPLAACRLPLAACRLPLAACRLPPAACRLSLIACRSSRDAGRATLASGSGETHDRASCAARGHARGHTGIPACPRPPQRFPPREKRANPPIFVMSPCEARNKTRAAFVFIHMGRRPPRRARDARPPDRCAARRRKWNRYGCFQPHARCSR
ncbi:putative lipoprotein [Burkholderia mallei]|nr:putative peptide chain release factor 1 [Burkholderia mallei]SQA73426.1 putative lipoprotein [Burkholderia mallei]